MFGFNPAIGFGDAAWGDYDNDGRPDFLITGQDVSGELEVASSR